MKREANKPGRRRRSAEKPPDEEPAEVSGGANVEADNVEIGGDVVGRDKLVAGDDIIQGDQYEVGPGAVVVGQGGRLINVSLPRGVQIAIGVIAVAALMIAFAVFGPVQTVVANGGMNGAVGQAPEGWEVKGNVRVVETGSSPQSEAGDRAAEFEAGSELAQRIEIPPDKSQLVVRYRSPSGQSRSTLEVHLDEELMLQVANPSDTEWRESSVPVPPQLLGKTVFLRIQYVTATGRVGGRLYGLALKSDDVVWVDNVQIVPIRDESIAQATIEPSVTVSLTPSHTPAPREPTSAPTDTPTLSPSATEARPTRTLRPATPTAAARVITAPLSFTWHTGDFRQDRANVWAQEVLVEPSGGAPPYTVAFETSGQQQTGVSFEVFGLFCEGQIGKITVRDSAGKSVSQNITIQDPICPTKTPTPTSVYTPTPAPPPSVVNGSFEQPSVPAGGWGNFSSIPGWSLSFGPSIEVLNNVTEYGLTAADGAQLVELDSESPSGIYQDLPTVSGARYTLIFTFGARPGSGPDENALDVWWDGSLLATLRLDGIDQSSPVWNDYSYVVTATGSTTRLEFRDVGMPSTQGTLLDNVRMASAP
jgi:hypothetical protein